MADTKQFVGFQLRNEHYGVDIMGVEEIIRLQDITPVPRAPDFVEGIINLRNQIIPIVDLRKRLRMPVPAENENTRIIVMKIETRRLGFMVDRVEEVMYISTDLIEDAPGMSGGVQGNYVDGVARTDKGMIIILDVVKIFSPEEHMQLSMI
ncbi:MAG: chemotaxis protein CheW [Deferribacteraceae bacterium]|jgi:purine-binding chemotaxis protein CheW|nr:chemotaxis protein CheW [Deferribacteraceae bacterium]